MNPNIHCQKQDKEQTRKYCKEILLYEGDIAFSVTGFLALNKGFNIDLLRVGFVGQQVIDASEFCCLL